MDNLIYITPDGLPKDVCSEIINRFERSDEKVKGMTTKGINEDMKKSTELFISPKKEWKDIDDIIYKSMSKHIDIYAENFKVDNKPFWCPNGQDEGYNIKRYEPGDYYHWHVDHLVRHDGKEGSTRILSFIWYLNDMDDGGYTEFHTGQKVNPRAGQLLIFPSTWNYPHRGVTPVSGNKYIIVSFYSINTQTLEFLRYDK